MFPHCLSPRLQDTTLALWIPCAALAGFEVGLSVWCVLVALTLRGLALCGNSYIKEQVCVCLNWCYYDLFISPSKSRLGKNTHICSHTHIDFNVTHPITICHCWKLLNSFQTLFFGYLFSLSQVGGRSWWIFPQPKPDWTTLQSRRLIKQEGPPTLGVGQHS